MRAPAVVADEAVDVPAAAGGGPWLQSPSGQLAAVAAGGGPQILLTHSLALAAVAARVSEPTARPAKSTARAATRPA
jgi:hypothetical protein